VAINFSTGTPLLSSKLQQLPMEQIIEGVFKMKYAIFAALTVFAVVAFTPEADAVVCARGVRGAACAGPHGAAAVRRPVGHCAIVRGRRVCG
jgi:hypothetical protein